MLDLADMFLGTQAELQAAVRELERELIEPMARRALRRVWMELPDEMQEEFKRTRPRDYAALMKDLQEAE